MSRCSSAFLALLLLTSGAALAKGKPPPKPEASSDMPMDLQLIGWSKDEKRFAVRSYHLTGEEFAEMDEPPPYCPGYVDHRGKKFRGSLTLRVYKGATVSGNWPIQNSDKCTPPEMARDRLAQVKAALAQQEIDLAALGTMVMPRKSARKPTSRRKGKTTVTTSVISLELPGGPWARRPVDIILRIESKDDSESEDASNDNVTSRATFTVSLRSGKKPAPLGEFTLGPAEWNRMMAGHWTPTVDRLLLSPSGKRFVLLAHLSDGNMRDLSESSVVLGLVELPESPESATTTSAPAR